MENKPEERNWRETASDVYVPTDVGCVLSPSSLQRRDINCNAFPTNELF
jgi:hypothetical protein